MSSFYVTLLSDSPVPGNATNKFTVVLPEKLSFSNPDNWEVALMSISYPVSFDTVGQFSKQFIKIKWEDRNITIDIPNGMYQTPEKLKDVLNINCRKHIENFDDDHPENALEFYYDDVANRFYFQCVPPIEKIEMSKQLQYMLGFEKIGLRLNHAKFSPDFFGGIHSVFVYCNIIASQIVGNVKTNLLRIFNVRGTQGDVIEEVFTAPQFCALFQKEINEISVELRSGNSYPLKFNWGTVRLTLCFRKKSLF